MVRRVSLSQLKSMARQAEQKQKQAIDNYNRAARNYNQKVNQAINTYNQEVKAHNTRVITNRQRIRSELERLQRHSNATTVTTTTTTRYTVFRTSVQTMHQAYLQLEEQADTQYVDPSYASILELSEKEAANSLEVMNALLGDGHGSDEETLDDLQTVNLTDELRNILPDLDDRWRGAVFSLHPHNPDAARHFCTSSREIFTQIFEVKAPDAIVSATLPGCEKTSQGSPTRRAKIQYFLHVKGMMDKTLEEFSEQNMDNIIQLFRVFNDGTHGSVGKFDFIQLSAIKKRVEQGLYFLSELVN